MIQTAKVKEIISPGIAVVAVKRVSACAHDCSKCTGGGCQIMEHPDLTVRAYNKADAKVGDLVQVESSSRTILTMAAVVYLLPFVLLFIGYGVGAWLGLGESGSILLGGVCFLCSFLISFFLNRRMSGKVISFSITRVLS